MTFGIEQNKVKQWLVDNAESKHAAVYAVFGKDEEVKFVGMSRNVVLSLAAHLANEGEDKVQSVKVRTDIPTVLSYRWHVQYRRTLCVW